MRAAVPDPLANVPQCGNGGLGDGTTTTIPSECPTNVITTQAKHLPATLSPGIYNDGIENAHTLLPGVYVLKGDIDLNGNDTLQGDGVMLYMACSNYPSPCAAGATGAGIKATGNSNNGSLRLTAPTSGTFKGLTLFADRNNTAVQTFRGNGSNESGPQSGSSGTIYLKSGTLDLRGNGYTLASMIVTKKLLDERQPLGGHDRVRPRQELLRRVPPQRDVDHDVVFLRRHRAHRLTEQGGGRRTPTW